mmetsp:Transcript_111719/g.256101  ORF Transcript_111719/g.256101 Transcript_111719/m.256101 type:complete len:249 (-) Transcript_111719:496-1242(-)
MSQVVRHMDQLQQRVRRSGLLALLDLPDPTLLCSPDLHQTGAGGEGRGGLGACAAAGRLRLYLVLLGPKIIDCLLNCTAARPDVMLGEFVKFPAVIVYLPFGINVAELQAEVFFTLAERMRRKHVGVFEEHVGHHAAPDYQHQHHHQNSARSPEEQKYPVILKLTHDPLRPTTGVVLLVAVRGALQVPGEGPHARELRRPEAVVGLGRDGKRILAEEDWVHEGDHGWKSMRNILEVTSLDALPVADHQ